MRLQQSRSGQSRPEQSRPQSRSRPRVAEGAFLPQSRVAQVRLPQSRVKHRGVGGTFHIWRKCAKKKRQHMQQHDTHLTFPSFFLHSSFFMSFSSAAPRARQLHKHHSSLCSSQLLFCSSSSFLLPRPRPLSLCVTLAAISSQALAAAFFAHFP